MLSQQKIIFKESVFTQELDGEMVLFDMESEHYFGLDETGTVMWQLLQEKRELTEVLSLLLEQYEVEERILKKDLLHFLDKLQENGLIEVTAKAV